MQVVKKHVMQPARRNAMRNPDDNGITKGTNEDEYTLAVIVIPRVLNLES